MGGRVAGKAEIITNSAKLGFELGLSLAKKSSAVALFQEI